MDDDACMQVGTCLILLQWWYHWQKKICRNFYCLASSSCSCSAAATVRPHFLLGDFCCCLVLLLLSCCNCAGFMIRLIWWLLACLVRWLSSAAFLVTLCGVNRSLPLSEGFLLLPFRSIPAVKEGRKKWLWVTRCACLYEKRHCVWLRGLSFCCSNYVKGIGMKGGNGWLLGQAQTVDTTLIQAE